MMTAVLEDTKPVQRRTPAEKKRDAMVARCRAEVEEKHGDGVECVFSLWGVEVYVAVWQDGKCVGNYEYLEEE